MEAPFDVLNYLYCYGVGQSKIRVTLGDENGILCQLSSASVDSHKVYSFCQSIPCVFIAYFICILICIASKVHLFYVFMEIGFE